VILGSYGFGKLEMENQRQRVFTRAKTATNSNVQCLNTDSRSHCQRPQLSFAGSSQDRIQSRHYFAGFGRKQSSATVVAGNITTLTFALENR
jgi:hypothetical protein